MSIDIVINKPECSVCRKSFLNEEDWENRHSDLEGEDCHSECCPVCEMENYVERARELFMHIEDVAHQIWTYTSDPAVIAGVDALLIDCKEGLAYKKNDHSD